jgi:hypothetical protein
MNGDTATPEGMEGLARVAREALDPGHVSGRNPERAARGDEPSGLPGRRSYAAESREFRRASRSGDR